VQSVWRVAEQRLQSQAPVQVVGGGRGDQDTTTVAKANPSTTVERRSNVKNEMSK
jgi:hypothetical protein